MSKVLVTKSKLDTLASVIGGKSGETVPMTIDEMTSAVEGIQTGGGPANLQTKSETYTPSTSSQSDVIVADAGYDGLDEVDVTVSAVPIASFVTGCESQYYTENGARKWRYRGFSSCSSGDGDTPGYIEDNTFEYSLWSTHNSIATGTSVTPTESAQTIGGANYMMEGAVTVSAIPSNYVGSGITRRSSYDITFADNTVNVRAGYYAVAAATNMPSGTAGTPTATKGAVSNHSIDVTPSVTNTSGYITGSTKTGTAVTVTASELVSGDKSITQNGTNIDVTNYETVSVAVPSPFELTYSYDSVNDVFTFDKTYAEIKAAIQDDEQIIYISSSEQVLGDIYDDGYYTNKTVSGTTFSECVALLLQANIDSRDRVVVLYYGLVSGVLTQKWVKSYVKPYDAKSISSNGSYIDVNDYSAVHVSVSPNLQAKTNIDPTTSSQTITADNGYDGLSSVQINAMPSQSLPSSASSSSSGTRKATIASSNSTQYINIPTGYNSTAQYYQLSAPTAMTLPTTTSSTSSGTLKATVTPGTSNKYINIPTGNNTAAAYYTVSGDANLVAGNIKNGTTIFGVTGSYTGGGSSMNVQTHQSTSRTTSTSLSSVNSLTCSTTGTYDVYWTCARSSTSGTWSSRLYIAGTASGDEQTTWTNHVQTVKLTGVSINANQTVAVYAKSRGSNYYAYAPQLTIVQTE